MSPVPEPIKPRELSNEYSAQENFKISAEDYVAEIHNILAAIPDRLWLELRDQIMGAFDGLAEHFIEVNALSGLLIDQLIGGKDFDYTPINKKAQENYEKKLAEWRRIRENNNNNKHNLGGLFG